MKDIKEARERLSLLRQDVREIEHYSLAKFSQSIHQDIVNEFDTLDQFITDTENLIKENEELKKENANLKAKVYGEQLNIEDLQFVEPSVLEKIDKLEKELENEKRFNADAICRLGEYQAELFETEKQLTITDKALDKACLYLSVDRPKISDKQWKEDLLKESKKESENTKDGIKN